jgi:hypothetical protein
VPASPSSGGTAGWVPVASTSPRDARNSCPHATTVRLPPREDVAHLVAVVERYGYKLGTPLENAAVGIQMPAFASGN